MALTQSGLTANDRSVIHTRTIPGTDVKVAVRIGPVGDLLVAAAARWNIEVEPLRAPDGVLDCWGFAMRTIRGSSTELSNHAGGGALDFRARAHPLGIPAARNYTPAQIAAIRRIVDDAEGALRWGGDYDNPSRGGVRGSRPDPMHLETNKSEAFCGQVLPRFLARSGVASAPAVPFHVSPLEDPEMPTIRVDEHGDFAESFMAEKGAGGWYADGIVNVGSTFGQARVFVTALSDSGYVWALSAKDGDLIDNNRSRTYQLPDGARSAVVEGAVQFAPDPSATERWRRHGTRPWAQFVGKRA